MRLCRYDDDKLGLIRGDQLFDATAALAHLPLAQLAGATG